jgi:putative tricarboxylic transport membrane protein
MKTADRIVAFFLIILGMLVFWQASQITIFSDELLGPSFFPKTLAIVLIFLGCLLLLRTVVISDFPKIELEVQGIWKITAVILCSVIYLLTLEPIGFLITTPLLMFALMMLLKRGKLLTKIAFSVLFPAIAWIVFKEFLKIPLPWGILN